jgi:hypothetical protein
MVGRAPADGVAERARLEKLGARGIPPRPQVKPAVVPPPPQLPPAWADVDVVRHLGRCYREVVQRRGGKQSHYLLAGDPCNHKDWPLLLTAAQSMRDEFIAPSAWVLWSFDTFPGAPSMPRVSWTFGSRLRNPQTLAWFEKDRDRYEGERILHAYEFIALYTDWETMWRDLMVKRPPDRPRVLEVVEQHFPGTSYEDRLHRAQVATVRLQKAIDLSIADGGVWWG